MTTIDTTRRTLIAGAGLATLAASLPGTDIQAAARITSVTLSSQKGENTVTTEIGTPILRRKQ